MPIFQVSKYHYRLLTPDLRDDWMRVFQESGDVWLYHDLDVCQFVTKQKGARQHSLIIYQSKTTPPIPLAICPLYAYSRAGRFFRSRPVLESIPHSGPAFLGCLGQKVRRELLHFLSRVLKDEMAVNGLTSCALSFAHLSEYGRTPPHFYANPLHELRDEWQNKPRAYYHLDLTKSQETLLSGMEVRCRTLLNKHQRESRISITKAGIEDRDIVHDLWAQAYNRVGLPYHPREDREWWLTNKHTDHYIAYVDKRPACVVRFTKFKGAAQLGGAYTAGEYLNTQVNTYAWWYAVMQLKNEGVTDLDLTHEDFSPLGSRADDIAKFKRSFGGELRYKYEMIWVRRSLVGKVVAVLLGQFKEFPR